MLEKLIPQMYWANALAIDWFKANSGSDPFFHKVTSHVLNAESIWVARIRGESHDTDTLRLVPAADMAARNGKNRDLFLAALAGDSARMIDYRLLNGDPGRTSVEDILLHVWSHGFHHRGQMAAKASTLGLKYPNVAYVSYTRR
jgi:uncharacterized damage-inducible protein DinB